jgi:putative DNA primase/helicase
MNTYQDAPAWPKFENLFGFKPTGEDKFTACCPGPSHSRGDHNPSLGIVIGKKQQIVPTCFVACTREEILAAMGVQERDLYPPRASSARAEQEKPLRLEDAVAVYDYTDESETILFKVGRFEP